MGEGYRN